MKHRFLFSFCLIAAGMSGILPAWSQEGAPAWTLEQCMEHARTHHLSIQQSRLGVESSDEDIRQAKAAFAPSVSAGSSQNFNYAPLLNSPRFGYSANYNIGLTMTLWDGGRMVYSKKQALLNHECKQQGLLTAQKEMDMSILQAYLQVLYARENVVTAEHGVELAQNELDRAEILFNAGKITKADRAQVASKLSQNQATLTNAVNSRRSALLTLKQLLELPIDSNFDIDYPVIDDSQVLTLLPDMIEIYRRAMETMPQMQQARYENESAQLGVKTARSGWLPSVSFNASLGGSYNTLQEPTLGEQFKNNFGLSSGFSINIPIYDRSQTRASVNKAKINVQQSELNLQQVEKTISKYVESLYIDAQNAQANFQAALNKLAYAQESYKLVSEQFRVGLKNTVEMLTGQENLVSAEQALIQSRYQAVISLQLLNLLQDEPVSIGQ